MKMISEVNTEEEEILEYHGKKVGSLYKPEREEKE
jgi:hypothetical protein